MKYTYQISFNGSDYSTLVPGNTIEMEGSWIEGTKIWRENISELKITKAENSSIYDTLETYFEDATYFTTRIFVKILKNSVEDSIHWFGIKWGTLNKELKTYVVQPLAYDFWAQYFETYLDVNPNFVGTLTKWGYFGTTGYFTFEAESSGTTDTTLENAIKTAFSNKTGWAEADIVSSFLWQDNYEDTSAVGTFQGMPLDYVTGEQTFLAKAGMNLKSNGMTPQEIIDNILALFRCYVFFDSNDKLRIEHIKFFNDKLVDNAVDFSSYVKAYDEEWSYNIVEMPTTESVEVTNDTDTDDSDFEKTDIVYNDVRNRVDVQSFSYSTIIRTLLTSEVILATDVIANIYTLWSSIDSVAYNFYIGTAQDLISTLNYIDAEMNVGEYIESNDFMVSNGQTFSFTADFTTSFLPYTVAIVERSTGTVLSNVPTVSTDTASETLTISGIVSRVDDAYLKITRTGFVDGFNIGWLALIPNNTTNYMIPTIEGVTSGNLKSNGAFSVGNIIDSYWQDDRISRTATINGSTYNFNNTQYNLRRTSVRFHYSGVINPLYGFNDGTRIGLIEKWTRDLDTDFYDIDVIYQEDE